MDQETYTELSTNYTQDYQCSASPVTKAVCYCPQGFYGHTCLMQVPTKCYVNVTDPPFYQRCPQPDTPEYMFSIPGFDPCYPQDFSQTKTVSFLVNCRQITTLAALNPISSNVGYDYRDVLVPAEAPKFQYQVENTKNQYRLSQAAPVTVTFTLFDWKWLSNYKNVTVTITDPEQLAGNTNATISIDFPELESSDREGKSHYVAGGRVYFETDVYNIGTTSMTGKGFFDKLGYVEPPAPGKSKLGLILGITIPIVVVLAGIGLYVYCKKKEKQRKAMLHMD